MEQILATEEKEVICNCPGCVGSLSHSLKLQGVKVSFGVNEILWAFGDDRKYMKDL
jgi:Fe-S oxidoreductase